MRLEDYDINRKFDAVVLSSQRITPEDSPEEVKELIFDVENKDFNYHIGQLVGVLVPGPHELGHKNHFRLYTIANPPQGELTTTQVSICVKRCNYIDEYSGEEFKGIASNYLCDLNKGSHITLTGPYGLPFQVPEDKDADILMIGMGTGIAPFRAFVKHIYHNLGDWQGKVRLYYGAQTGLEMLYMNDHRNDFANYYDEDTFKAFQAISPRPHWGAPAALDAAISENKTEVWDMICSHKTHVYVAGIEAIEDILEKTFSNIAGSKDKWQKRKAELMAGGRWNELIY